MSPTWPLDGGKISLPGPQISSREAVGITVAICGNILISFALNLQKLAHRRLELKRSQIEHPFSHTGAEEDFEDETSSEGGNTRVNSEEDTHHEQWTSGSIQQNGRSGIVQISETVPLLQQASSDFAHYDSPTVSVLALHTASPRKRRFPFRILFRRKSTPKPPPRSQPNIVLTPATPGVDSPSQHSEDDIAYSDEASSPSTLPESDSAKQSQETDYLKSKIWCVLPLSDILASRLNWCRWLGFLLMNIGEIGNFLGKLAVGSAIPKRLCLPLQRTLLPLRLSWPP
jgi:magnesium transporter